MTAPTDHRAVRRLGRPVLLVAVALSLVMPLVLSGGAPASAATSGPSTRSQEEPDRGRVLVVSFPRVTWERIRRQQPPALVDFFDGAALASASPRTVGSRTGIAQAYLTLGAGNRASAAGLEYVGSAAEVDTETSEGRAGDVWQRRTGETAETGIVSLAFPTQLNWNDRLLYGTQIGALADGLNDAGIGVAAVGNAGRSLDDESHREVALMAADSTGWVHAGEVGESLLRDDPGAPFGVTSDHDAHLAAVEAAWDDSGVVVVEMSDLERAEIDRAQSTPQQGEAQFSEALSRSDELFGELVATMDLERDLVVAISPAAPLAAEQLTLFAMRGPEVTEGWARSPTTRRPAYVTLPDLAPTVLRRFDLPVPTSMYDTPVTSAEGGGSVQDRVEAMATDSSRAVFRDRATGPITVGFILLLVAMLLAVAWSVHRRGIWFRAVRPFALTVLAIPPLLYLAGLMPYDRLTTVSYALVVLGVAVLLAVAADRTSRVDPVLPPLLLAGLCVAVLSLDILSGGHLQLNTMFGYSPIVAGRFAGFGNQAFSLIGICTLAVATAGWELWERRWPSSSVRSRVIAIFALFGLVVVLVGAPTLGSDVGGVLASVPAFAVCTLLLLGIRISLWRAAAIGAASVAVLGLFALVDLARPPESRTHLGRFVGMVLEGEAAVILERKLAANLSVLTSTVWTWIVPIALVFFAYLTWRPNSLMRRIARDHPHFRAFGISGLTLGVVAFALNDSGVSMPALMLGIVLPYTSYLALGVLRRESSGVEPVAEPRQPRTVHPAPDPV